MGRIEIVGGKPLHGAVQISGAKNAALKQLVAALLTNERCTLHNVPDLADVASMIALLQGLGVHVERNGTTVRLHAQCIGSSAPAWAARKMRASIQTIGPLLARLGQVRIALPGGCDLGARPIDLHLKGLRALGAVFVEERGYIDGHCERLVGNEIHLDVPSVGATENIMMAAVLAEGTSVILNAACEPEIAAAAATLNLMGARISGAGTSRIEIQGVTTLGGFDDHVIPDRIEAGTFLVAGAITGGDVTVQSVVPEHLGAVTSKLRESGVAIYEVENAVRAVGFPTRPIQVRTQPYPGFPTDMQPQLVALLSLTAGTSIVRETIYSSRFKYVAELRRMGADMVVEGDTCIVRGKRELSGTDVVAPDLRAGAALVLAGLAAPGVTVVDGAHHLDRGYATLEAKLSGLGARIRRLSDEMPHPAAGNRHRLVQ